MALLPALLEVCGSGGGESVRVTKQERSRGAGGNQELVTERVSFPPNSAGCRRPVRPPKQPGRALQPRRRSSKAGSSRASDGPARVWGRTCATSLLCRWRESSPSSTWRSLEQMWRSSWRSWRVESGQASTSRCVASSSSLFRRRSPRLADGLLPPSAHRAQAGTSQCSF